MNVAAVPCCGCGVIEGWGHLIDCPCRWEETSSEVQCTVHNKTWPRLRTRFQNLPEASDLVSMSVQEAVG